MDSNKLKALYKDFEEAEIELGKAMRDSFENGESSENEEAGPEYIPSYISNKYVEGKSCVMIFGKLESCIVDLLYFISAKVREIIDHGGKGTEEQLFTFFCQAYDQKYGTHFFKNNQK